jgi:hypothetical protein
LLDFGTLMQYVAKKVLEVFLESLSRSKELPLLADVQFSLNAGNHFRETFKISD